MRITRLALAALFAVLAFSAMAASSASAFHPLFITQSGKELLFSGLGGKATLRSANGGVVECEKTLIHGFALHLSTLAHRILLLFEGKCELVSPIKAACSNQGTHITLKLLLGELGLLTATNHKVLILLAPASGTESAKFECGIAGEIAVTGAIVGEIPEINAKGVNQYNKPLTEMEQVFESVGKNSEKQAIQEIFLLGTQMTGVHLLTNGNEASEEIKSNPILKGDGTIEITTTKE
jgi:hypothetical protein